MNEGIKTFSSGVNIKYISDIFHKILHNKKNVYVE